MSRHRTHRRDANHVAVVSALRRIGATVLDLGDVGGGAPDLLVGYRGRTVLVEVKSRDTSYGRRGLTETQRTFAETWRGGAVVTVESEQEAVRVMLAGLAD